MSNQIIKQPNGKFAVWSTIVDDFVWRDGTPEQIVNAFVAAERQRIEQRVQKVCKSLDEGEKPYNQFTMTWEEAVRRRDRVRKLEEIGEE